VNRLGLQADLPNFDLTTTVIAELCPKLEAVIEVLGKSKFALNRLLNELTPVTFLMLYADREAFELMSGGIVLWMLGQLSPEHAGLVQDTGLLAVLEEALLLLEPTLGKEPELLFLWQDRSVQWFRDLYKLCCTTRGDLHRELSRGQGPAAGAEAEAEVPRGQGPAAGAEAEAEVLSDSMRNKEFFAQLRRILPAWRVNPQRCIEFHRLLACAAVEFKVGNSLGPVNLRTQAGEDDPLGLSPADAYPAMLDFLLQLAGSSVQFFEVRKGDIRADRVETVLEKLNGKTAGVLRIIEGAKLHAACKTLVQGLPANLPIKKGLGRSPLKRKLLNA